MLKRLLLFSALALLVAASAHPQAARTRLAIVGLDHDHVWGILQDIAKEPLADLVAIADPHPELVERARKQVPATVKFYSDYVQMLDEARPEGVIVTTENDRHLEILRECAKRHINYSTEKPLASTTADAKEMERLARAANIKLMVNYWNVWVAPSHELYHRAVTAHELGPIQKIIVEQGHQGPKEIGVSKYFGDWLYDPAKNGGGALIDFGCYGAEWVLWLKGRPARVFAFAQRLKREQHNRVDDDATIVLEYPDAVAILEASWDWPYSMGQVQVFGPQGSLLATNDALLYRPAKSAEAAEGLDGRPVPLARPAHETSSPIAYFVDCIRHDRPIENPLAGPLNVSVVEILDAAKESIRTGQAVEMPAE